MGKRGFRLLLGLVCTLSLIIVGVSTMKAENVSANGGFTYLDKGSYVVLTKYTGSSSSVNIPSEYNGKPVTEIGARAFYDNTSIKSVTIPSTVTVIGSGAFMKCTNLTDITIPDSVVGMTDAFGWSGIENVYIGKSVKRISNQTFQSCTKLKKVTVANPNIIWGNGSESVGTINLSGTPKFTICAPSGSTSQTFANNNGLGFETYSGGGTGGGSSSECSHNWTRDDSDTRNSQSTCTTYGNIVQKCTKCGTTRVVKRTALAAHQLGGWETVRLATKNSNGEAVRKCFECGNVIERKELYYNGSEGEVVTVAPPDNTGSGSGNEGNSGGSGSSGNSGNEGNSSGGSSGSGNSGGSSSSGSSGGSGGSGSSSGSGGSGSSSGSGDSSGGSGNGSGNSSGSGNSGLDDIEYGDPSSAADVNNDLSALDPDKVLKPSRTIKSIPVVAVVGVVGVILAIGLFVIKRR